MIFLAGLSASTLSNIVGHGGALFLLPFLAIWFEPQQVIGLAVFYYITMNIARIVFFFSGIVWWAVGALTILALPFAILGVLAIEWVASPIWMRMLIGTFIFVFILNELWGKEKSPEIRKRVWPLVVVGAPYGFLSGFLSSGSIVRTPVMIRCGFTKEFFIATTATSSLVVNIPKVYLYNRFEFFALTDMTSILALALGAVLGTMTGKRYLQRISPSQFKNYVLMILAILAAVQFFMAARAYGQ